MSKANKLVWNVYREDFNQREIEVFNIFDHASFSGEAKESLKKSLSSRDLSERLDSIARYYFWCKAEYEVVITSWPPYIDKEELGRLKSEDVRYRVPINPEVGVKVSVYDQLRLNWDAFINYLWNSK